MAGIASPFAGADLFGCQFRDDTRRQGRIGQGEIAGARCIDQESEQYPNEKGSCHFTTSQNTAMMAKTTPAANANGIHSGNNGGSGLAGRDGITSGGI